MLAVDTLSGTLIFSRVSVDEIKSADPGADTMSPEAFASLLQRAGASLVVLATCRALALAAKVSPVANMAAALDDITGEAAAKWCDLFYGLLAQGKSVYSAFDVTSQVVKTPIIPIRHKDVAFTLTRS